MRLSLERERGVAIRAVIAASNLCSRVRNSMADGSTMVKGDRSPVTIADFGSQAVVCRILKEAFPADPIVAEEDSRELARPENEEILREVVRHVQETIDGASPKQVCSWIDLGRQNPAQRFWTLDPIDGTKGFLRGDQYAIALALIEDGEVRLGVLGCPNLSVAAHHRKKNKGAVFMALRGRGAVQNDLKRKTRKSIAVSQVANPSEARFTESFESAHSDQTSHQRVARRLGIGASPLRMDSQAKYAVLARGDASLYLRLPSPATPDYRERIWDHAAGSIIIEEAGGRVTDAYGRDLDFSEGSRLERNRGIVATNGLLHDAVLNAVRFELMGDR
ncbi:MAG: 3'(2'),5'-bisphosphate nucleotidase [Proteobacteria bacterium]|nr:3'(2'),5'-bisphosphate nucleotidase [Pseudomonadota bacterium]